MAGKFYLNYQFFDFYLGCYIPIFDDVFLHIIKKFDSTFDYHKRFRYDIEFCVKAPDTFIPVFSAYVLVSSRKIVLHQLVYCLESALVVSNLKYFPISPAWFLPCTNYQQWLRRCECSLRVYRKSDYI